MAVPDGLERNSGSKRSIWRWPRGEIHPHSQIMEWLHSAAEQPDQPQYQRDRPGDASPPDNEPADPTAAPKHHELLGTALNCRMTRSTRPRQTTRRAMVASRCGPLGAARAAEISASIRSSEHSASTSAQSFGVLVVLADWASRSSLVTSRLQSKSRSDLGSARCISNCISRPQTRETLGDYRSSERWQQHRSPRRHAPLLQRGYRSSLSHPRHS